MKPGSIKQALGLLQNDLDKEEEALLNQIETGRVRAKTVFAQTRGKIEKRFAGVQDDLASVHDYLDDLEKSNGGPSLDDSAESSKEPEPQASWSGQKGQG